MQRSTQVALASAVILLCGMTAWAFRTTPEVGVVTAPVTEGPITRRVVATGTLQAVTTVEVGAQVSGTIQSIEVDFNSIVHAGQIIARLDPSLFQAAVQQADAALEQARAALQQAQSDLAGLRTASEDARIKLSRATALADRQLLQASDLDAARIAMGEAIAGVAGGDALVEQAKAGIVQATAAVKQAAVNLDRTTIRSPIDGIVIERDVDVGQTVAAVIQAPVLFRIAADLRRMQVQVDIDESDIGGVLPGETASFEVETYPDDTFSGVITQVRLQPVAEQTTTATTVATATTAATSSLVATVISYTVIIDVVNLDEQLRPGMTAEVSLTGSRRERAVRIPNAALSFRPPAEVLRTLGQVEPEAPADEAAGGTRARLIWRYDGKHFTPVAVHTGLADAEWTEVASGSIRPGDPVVTSAMVRRRSRL